ncbi:MAG: glycoside hydrolase family 5 protein [Myxococcota bacterium]
MVRQQRFRYLTMVVILSACSASAATYEVNGAAIKRNGEIIQLFGVNWFGAETQDHVPHGLWSRNYREMSQQIREVGFNAVRLPFCPATLQNVTPTSIDYTKNNDLQGLGSLEVFDAIVAELDRNEIYILIDHHRPDCNSISELWYFEGYSEEDWIDDLVFVASRYANVEHFVGIDLKNEPHGAATWGTGNLATDWDRAAELAADAVLAANSNILVFVEGIQENPVCASSVNHWWGGNLEPEKCAPLDISPNKLVFSPHVYGPDVFQQPYFSAPNFPANLPSIWSEHFGFLGDQGRALAPGEFGGRYGHGGEADDVPWQNELVDYFIDKRICNFFYWSWNPNSGDTGGILQDDWNTVWQDKVDNLSRLMTTCRDDLAGSNPTGVPALASGTRGLLLVFIVVVALFEMLGRPRPVT